MASSPHPPPSSSPLAAQMSVLSTIFILSSIFYLKKKINLKISRRPLPWHTKGAIHSTKISTGPTGKRGPPQKVDQFFRNFSGWTEPIHWVLDRNFRKFWLNGSRPKCWVLGPVSQKSRNFSGLFRVPLFPLYLRNAEVLSLQTSQSSWFFLYYKHVKRSAFQNKRIAVWQLAFRARKVLGTFEKRAPGIRLWPKNLYWAEARHETPACIANSRSIRKGWLHSIPNIRVAHLHDSVL